MVFYFNTFLIFSILGYLFEMISSFLMNQKKLTLLLGPWMPIYGIGLLLTHLINEVLEKHGLHGWLKIFFCFLISIFFLTILEEIGGLLVEILFAKKFWNYENIPLSIGPYINIFISLIWGGLAVFLEFIIFPILMPLIKKIPKWLTILVTFLFFLDNFVVWYRHFALM